MNRSPVIGITTDYKEKENTYSKYPWFALRRHYSDCLYKFGCTPIVLPITETIENIDFLDGLLISGGDFDIDPKYYGENIQSDKIQTIKERTKFEFEISYARINYFHCSTCYYCIVITLTSVLFQLLFTQYMQ